MIILSLEQHLNQVLDTPPEGRWAGKKTRDYMISIANQSVRRFNKAEYNQQQVIYLQLLH